MFTSKLITIAAGTVQQIVTTPTWINRLRITPLIGAGCAVVYVLSQKSDPLLDAQAKNGGNFIAELAPATATVPGGVFELDRIPDLPPFNLQEFAIDGAHTGDTVNVAWE